MEREPPSLRAILKRGIAKRCPHCGKGPQFKKWFSLHTACPVCGYKLEGNPGDTWGFWILGDRILIAVTIALLYFGFTPQSWWGRGLFLASVIIPLVWTMPHRKGVGVALDYLSRIYLNSSDEDFPPLPHETREAASPIPSVSHGRHDD